MKQSVLIIDIEAIHKNLDEGINFEMDRIMEIAAVKCDWESGQPVEMLSRLINEKDRLPISQELTDLTKLTDEIIELEGISSQQSIESFLLFLTKMAWDSDYLLSHNATNYDKCMLLNMLKRYHFNDNEINRIADKVWIDSLTDIKFPSSYKHKDLMSLGAYHGFINPFPHRALTDCLSLLRIASNYALEDMVNMAKSEVVTIRAIIPPPRNWNDETELKKFNELKTKIKKSGFRWMPKRKVWERTIVKIELEDNFDFDYLVVE